MTALLDGNPIPVRLFGTNDNYEWRPFIIWSSTPGSVLMILARHRNPKVRWTRYAFNLEEVFGNYGQ